MNIIKFFFLPIETRIWILFRMSYQGSYSRFSRFPSSPLVYKSGPWVSIRGYPVFKEVNGKPEFFNVGIGVKKDMYYALLKYYLFGER